MEYNSFEKNSNYFFYCVFQIVTFKYFFNINTKFFKTLQ